MIQWRKPTAPRRLRTLPIPRGPVNIARQIFLRAAISGLSAVYAAYRVHPAVWRFTARNYHPKLEEFARLNAWMMCQHGFLDVPAYQDHLALHGWEFRWWDLANYPETTKGNYVRRYTEQERSWKGRLKTIGTVVDESSGSSGQPTNWMRSKSELYTIHKNLAGFTTMLHGSRNLFCINAFSMGAWATGTNTGLAMAQVATVKNTGPDLDKILDTMEHFGPGHTYLITAYPPFLKHVVDRMDQEPEKWRKYRINAFVGGEAMTEGLRDYLEARLGRVYSGYGASDLTIGLGGETDLSVCIRKACVADPDFRRALLGEDEARTPMIFQYNPLETYLETTAEDELVVTLNTTAVMNPKLRYNIGDEAKLYSFPEMMELLADHPRVEQNCRRAFRHQRMKLPFLLLYGRKDATISYMGANIYPLDVENGLYGDQRWAPHIESFRTELVEATDLETRPVIHVELRADAALTHTERTTMSAALAEGVVAHLASVSRDFRESLEEDASAGEITVRLHEHRTGPFAGDDAERIKNVYLVTDD